VPASPSAGEVEQFTGFGEARAELVQHVDHALELRALAAQFLGTLRLVPDRGVFELPQHLGQALALALVVKDTP
jgi:hypothetical protein